MYHPDYERYVFGQYNAEIIADHGAGMSGMAWLWKHGVFSQFDFSLPIGNPKAKGEGVFRITYAFSPTGSDLIFKNQHLVHIRIDKRGLITFSDAFYDDAVLADIVATTEQCVAAEAPKDAPPVHTGTKGKGKEEAAKKK